MGSKTPHILEKERGYGGGRAGCAVLGKKGGGGGPKITMRGSSGGVRRALGTIIGASRCGRKRQLPFLGGVRSGLAFRW